MHEEVVAALYPLKLKAVILQAFDDLSTVQLYTLIHIVWISLIIRLIESAI
jgi:hypothetical protein